MFLPVIPELHSVIPAARGNHVMVAAVGVVLYCKHTQPVAIHQVTRVTEKMYTNPSGHVSH